MLLASLLLILQAETRATQPTYFLPVVLVLLITGGLAWLIAAVLGFQRARAFGPSARWFSLSAVCLIIYHLQFVLLGIVAMFNRDESDLGMVLNVGAFFNLFVVLGGICAILGFVKLTNPE
ncbi:MAG: hypothetical protein ICV60_02250 [Pyrinomonadaceae bacterium]|nr:hypothetical protein [Pyrinomonadaceae bacterium]